MQSKSNRDRPPHVGDVFPQRFGRGTVAWVRCGDGADNHQTCRRVLREFVLRQRSDGRIQLEGIGNGPPPQRDLERADISPGAAAVLRSRPHVDVIKQDGAGVTVRCKCGLRHRIDTATVEDAYLDKLRKGNKGRIDIWMRELRGR